MATINVQQNRNQTSKNEIGPKVVSCFTCGSEMNIEEGTVLYNSHWFHNDCWDHDEKSKPANPQNIEYVSSGNKLPEFAKGQADPHKLQDAKKVLVVGLGEIGYTNAEYMTKQGLWVEGYDINPEATKRALGNNIIKRESQGFAGYDYYIICVSTHKPENQFIPYLDGLYEVVYRIAREGTKGALLGVDSTIPRGTTRKIHQILDHKLHVVHVPHRYYRFEKQEHGVNQKRVFGACEDCCYDKAVEFYGKLLQIPLHRTNDPDVAELTKVAENAYRYVEIAFVEELKVLCDNIGLEFAELRQAINTKWNTNLLEAKGGIGGHCLPKDSQMLLDICKEIIPNSIIEAAKKVDSQYRVHLQHQLKTTTAN